MIELLCRTKDPAQRMQHNYFMYMRGSICRGSSEEEHCSYKADVEISKFSLGTMGLIGITLLKASRRTGNGRGFESLQIHSITLHKGLNCLTKDVQRAALIDG
jgi:hypothetical protein